jgi:hypothetical protein
MTTLDENRTVQSLHHICTRMKKMGYEYGGLVSPMQLLPKISSCKSLGDKSNKPEGEALLWFSDIVELYSDSGDEDSGKEKASGYTLAWVDWIEQENFNVKYYSLKDLVFVKTNPARVVTESDPRFGQHGLFVEEKGWGITIKWPDVACHFGGITVDLNKAYHNAHQHSRNRTQHAFSGWDVDSLVVWDRDCITDVQIFKNVGSPWKYT